MYDAPQAIQADSSFLADAVSFSRHSGELIAMGAIPALDSSELFKDNKVVAIHHNGLVYRLQLTKLGKLILTK